MADYNKIFESNPEELEKFRNSRTRVGDTESDSFVEHKPKKTKKPTKESKQKESKSKEPRPKKVRKPRSKGERLIIDFGIPIVAGIIIGIVLIVCIGRATVKGDSMEPTLKNGQTVLLQKTNKNIKQYDIVFAHSKELETDIVKRVIAVEGDKVELRGTDIYVNGKATKTSFCKANTNAVYAKEIVVPKGYVYVVGDNRDNSTDSRKLGSIKLDDVFGKALFH